MYNYINIEGSNDYKIPCKVWESKNTNRVIVACHGFASNKESGAISMLAENMIKKNTTVIAFDLPGHGESEVDGDYFSVKNCLNDFKEVINYVKEKYPNAKINIFSSSFGAYLTLLLLTQTEETYENVILRCPAIKMDECFKEGILENRKFEKEDCIIVGYERKLKVNYDFYYELTQNKLFDIFKNTNQRILIIHGDSDTTAPTTDSINFAKKFDIPIKLVKGADHRFKKPGELEEVIKLTEKFIG